MKIAVFSDSHDHIAAGQRSGQRLIDLATATNGTIIYGHDPDQWPTLPKAPESWT